MGSGNWWPAVREGELVRYLDEEEYVRLLDDTIPVSAEPGDVIFFKGAPSTSMVIVVSGELEVFEESKGKVHVLGTLPVNRPDEPHKSLPRDEVLASAPDPAPEAGLFRVPRVIG